MKRKRMSSKNLTIADINALARKQGKTYGQLVGEMEANKLESVKERMRQWEKKHTTRRAGGY